MRMLSTFLGKRWRASLLDSGECFLHFVGSSQTVFHRSQVTLHSHLKWDFLLLHAHTTVSVLNSGHSNKCYICTYLFFLPFSQVPLGWSLCPPYVLEAKIQGLLIKELSCLLAKFANGIQQEGQGREDLGLISLAPSLQWICLSVSPSLQ